MRKSVLAGQVLATAISVPGFAQAAQLPETILQVGPGIEANQSMLVVSNTDKRGYVLELSPDYDVNRNIPVFTAVLRRSDIGEEDENMIDGADKLHGYQAYTFSAQDFENGIDRSIFGRLRHLSSAKAKVDLFIFTCRAVVQRIGSSLGFKELTLIVSSQKDFTKTSQCSIN